MFKKFGLPQDIICLSSFLLKCGRQKRSRAFFLKKGIKAIMAQRNMPRHVASAAAQIPQPRTPRNINSIAAIRTDMRMFKNMLPRIYPQILR